MSALLIKNFPPDLHQRLKKEAERNHRSMTRQALVLIEQALSPTQAVLGVKKDLPKPIDLGTKPSSQWIYKAIRAGRK